MIKLNTALREGILSLGNNGADVDARLLLCHVLKKPKTFIYAYPEYELSESQLKSFQALIKKRAKGQPIAYLTGFKDFFELKLRVNEHTLIPRPETEKLVELALDLVNKDKANILDLGTGSGAIALSLAHARPNWNVCAVDKSLDALLVAKENAATHGITNVRFIESDWLQQLDFFAFDAIIANPPYIAREDPHLNKGDVRFEPREALVGGPSGLEALQKIIKTSYNYLLDDGLVLVEHGYDQKIGVKKLFIEAGYQYLNCWQDLAQVDRVSGGRKINVR